MSVDGTRLTGHDPSHWFSTWADWLRHLGGLNVARLRAVADALDSGAYRQGEGWLKFSTGTATAHCCLGVAVELALRDGVAGAWALNSGSGVWELNSPGEGLSKVTVLSPSVAAWLGLSNEQSDVLLPCDDGGFLPASRLNDSGVSFSRIARAFRELADLAEAEQRS